MICHTVRFLLLWVVIWILAACLHAFPMSLEGLVVSQPTAQGNEKSVLAFRAVASVLTSPRCLNCHAPNDGPLQGDDNHPHAMNVKRGSDGKGSPALRCRACHQTENAGFLHGPPGAADWQLPPEKTPMAWKGLSTGKLCRTLKDPAKNGNRSLQDLIPHTDTSLVRWAWNPGPGRTVPPLSHDEFVSRLKEWIETGAACPE
jgi:hypothetical protein